jgi:chemotaxis protein CheX
VFTSEQIEGVNKITCPVQLGAAEADAFRTQIKSWGLLQVELHVLDLKSTLQISKEFYQAMLQFKSLLKAGQKSSYSINVDRSILTQLRADGMEQAFSPADSINDALKKAGIVKKARTSINVEFINPFLAATIKTLEVQANTPVTPQKPYLKKDANENIAIAGVISLVSDKFSGSVAICFPKDVFLTIYENMFSEKHETITKELEDAAGELLNIIYGQVKVELNAKAGYHFKKALPTVFTGEKINVSQQGKSPAVVIPFQGAGGTFFIEIELERP